VIIECVAQFRAYFPSFYYDVNTRTCLEFIYGGCGGNGNRFDTVEKCMAVCFRRQQV
ncbi:unnamed protein product, partial [Nippostrongylus brasiliensis]|uniref:BPTI/Kunitz inhibitor domain-containing protein n=1 Tax=Nippostrongylus brasiliensis TaxID=27835 RepID=A0A0N4YAZ0_NIPBR